MDAAKRITWSSLVLLAGCFESSALLSDSPGGSDPDVEVDVSDSLHLDGIGDDGDATENVDADALHEDAAAEDGHDWSEVATPDAGADDPVTEPVGPPIILDDETHAGGPLTVEWNGHGWGLAWGDMATPIVFRPLDEVATPLSPPVLVDPTLSSLYLDLEWYGDHYLLVAADGALPGVGFGPLATTIIDEWGARRGDTRRFLSGVDEPVVTWAGSVSGWLVGYITYDGSGDDDDIRAAVLDDSGELVGESRLVGAGYRNEGPRAISLKTGAAFAWHRADGVWYRRIEWPNVDDAPPPTLVLPSAGGTETTPLDAIGYWETVVMVVMDGRDVWSAAVDNVSTDILSGPTLVGPSRVGDRPPVLATALERGYLAVCYAVGPGPWGGGGDDGVALQLLRPDGSPLGAVLAVVEHLENIGGCAVGWSGSEFVVIYWSCGGDTVTNTILAQRVRPLI